MSIQLTDTERDLIKEQAEKDSIYLDNIGQAKKIAHGIEENDELSTNRALWELVQNAKDLCKDGCCISVEYYADRIVFKHNGKQFTPKTLNSLIKQISSKSDKDEEQVGQYGTGFLTTHRFGTKFKIEGSLEVKEGFYVDIIDYVTKETFLIDRSENDPEKLIEVLATQLINAKKLLDLPVSIKQDYTSFTYLYDSDIDKENALIALQEFIKLIPYVMVFNLGITKVEIHNHIDNNNFKYVTKNRTKLQNGTLMCTEILMEEATTMKFYSLSNESKTIEVILPLEDEYKANDINKLSLIPKLFLYYPLIQTENFGTNFIINSIEFYPKDKRNGVRLKANNPQRGEKEEHNRTVINEASHMILEYLKSNGDKISNGIGLSRISFLNEANGEYEKELQKLWVQTLLDLSLCDLAENNKAKVSEAIFFDEELRNTPYFNSIYYYASKSNDTLIEKSQIEQWSEIVEEWDSDNITFISCLDIVKSIEQEEVCDNSNELYKIHEYIKSIQKHAFFDEYAIIPNKEGTLLKKGKLLSPQNIDDELYKFMSIYLPDIAERFISQSFLPLFFESLEEYNRKSLQDDITTIVEVYNKKIAQNTCLSKEEYALLIKFCSFYPALDEAKSTQRQLMPLICKYYNIEYIEQFLPNIKEQEIDYRTAFRCLIRSFVLDMSFKDTEWIKLNREFVKDILRIMKNFRDFTDTLKLSGIYVNQNDIFCLPTDLKIESNIPEDLKAIYSVVKKKDVKNILVAEDFQMFWDFQEKDKLQGGTLANELEEVFFEEDISKINSHTYRETILNIINKITENTDNGLWSILFKDIENNKEVIMMATITDGERKNSMFKILTANEATLNTLASLTNEDDIDKILALGRQAYKKEQEDREEWEFKKSIGVHLENKINEELTQRLSSQNGTIKCISEQGGQDIIVNHNNNPIYFIEIKGRWSSRESVLMSKVQIDKAKENLDKYSICCINLFDYVDKEDSQKRFYPEMDIIEDRLKALNNIGSKVELLIPSKEDITETTVTLGGDYKAIVPQALFDGEGISFDQLIDIIIKDIK